MVKVSPRAICNISPYIQASDAEKVAQILNERGAEFGICNKDRMCAFLATIIHESGCFKYKKELASGKAYEGRKDLGNTEAGDGVKYKGRGYIQITGRANYQKVQEALKVPCIEKPELLESYPLCMIASLWWWHMNGCNQLADKGSIELVTRRVNGGYNGITERKKYYELAKLYVL